MTRRQPPTRPSSSPSSTRSRSNVVAAVPPTGHWWGAPPDAIERLRTATTWSASLTFDGGKARPAGKAPDVTGGHRRVERALVGQMRRTRGLMGTLSIRQQLLHRSRPADSDGDAVGVAIGLDAISDNGDAVRHAGRHAGRHGGGVPKSAVKTWLSSPAPTGFLSQRGRSWTSSVTFPEGWTVQSGHNYLKHSDAPDEFGFYPGRGRRDL